MEMASHFLLRQEQSVSKEKCRPGNRLLTNSNIHWPALLFCHSANICHRVRQVWRERPIDMGFQL